VLKNAKEEGEIAMVEPKLVVFKGEKSQTGLATLQEFTGIEFQGGDEKFADIAEMLTQEPVIVVLPLWNSHVGEIPRTRILELLFENKSRLYRVWPKSIEFECISKLARSGDKVGNIVSVHVAEVQCSRFISQKSAKFIAEDSTTEAYRRFREDAEIDAALCAPGQNEHGFRILRTDAANPMNFTSFVLLGCWESKDWSPEDWGALYERLNPSEGVYFGVQMPILSVASEDQEELLNVLTADAKSVDEIPKIIFVTKTPPDQCKLLFESSTSVLISDIMTEEGYSSEISISQDMGQTNSRYPTRICDFIRNNFADCIKYDFIRHIGTQTCFFACLPLGIVTHGFDERIVDPVVKLIINKYFELIDIGINCSPEQSEFFEKHKEAYYKHGMDFINFIDVGL